MIFIPPELFEQYITAPVKEAVMAAAAGQVDVTSQLAWAQNRYSEYIEAMQSGEDYTIPAGDPALQYTFLFSTLSERLAHPPEKADEIRSEGMSTEAGTEDVSGQEDSDEELEKPEPSKKSAARKSVPAKKPSSSALPKSANPDYLTVKGIPKSAVSALKRFFPENYVSRGDLISACIYVLTNGDCEISDAAMRVVESYKPEDGIVNMQERLGHIESLLRRELMMLYSVELCTCYNTFDRRYGSEVRRKSPKDNEFREQGNLDMLARLRRQARDQYETDNAERGRQIYNQTKDKND